MTEKTPLLVPVPMNTNTSRQSRRARGGIYGLAVLFLVSMIALRLVLLYSYLPFHHIPFGRHKGGKGDKYLAAARHILHKHPLIDGHIDLLIVIRDFYGNKINEDGFQNLWEHGGLIGDLDTPRVESGQMAGAFWSAWVDCPRNGSDFSNQNYAPAVRATLEQLDLAHRLAELYPKQFTPTLSAKEAKRNFRHNRLISPLAIEGLHQIGNSAGTLRLYHQLGVRYATLTWNCHNIYADAACTKNEQGLTVRSEPRWHGVSPAGRALVHEMNRLGMLVDLSHVSADTMRDVLRGSVDKGADPSWQGSFAPPIFSHSSAYAICPHPRNVPDDVLRLVKRRKGLVMVNVLPGFISCETSDAPTGMPRSVPENATLGQIVKHITYIGDLIGYDHVGIGTDFDGGDGLPKGFEGADKYPDLIAEMLRQGVSRRNAAKVAGGNLLRVWAEADAVSRRMKKDGWLPLEDDVKGDGQ